MKREQLGINTVSLRGELIEILDGCAAAGFRNIEFVLGPIKAFVTEHSLSALQRSLAERGLTCIGGFESGIEAYSSPEQQAANHVAIVENARLLAELGNGAPQTLVVGTDSWPSGESGDAVERYAQVIGEVAGKAAPLGVNIAIEFNWGAVKTLPMAAEIARRSGAANAGVLFDPAHFYCTPTKSEDLTPENVAMIKHVHVDTMRRKPAEISDCNADRLLPNDPGSALDVKALFGAIEAHGYRGLFSIEMFSDELWALPPEAAARKMFESLLPLCD